MKCGAAGFGDGGGAGLSLMIPTSQGARRPVSTQIARPMRRPELFGQAIAKPRLGVTSQNGYAAADACRIVRGRITPLEPPAQS